MEPDQLLALIAAEPGAITVVQHSHIHHGKGSWARKIVGCDPHPCQRPDGHVQRIRVDLPLHGRFGGAIYITAWEEEQ